MSVKTGDSFKGLQLWNEGILKRNIKKIKQALELGVPVNTNVKQTHPMYVLLTEPDNNRILQPASYSEKLEKIVDLLLDNGLSLLQETREEGIRLIDDLVMQVDTIMASKLTYSAIIEALRKEDFYEFNLDRIFELNTPEDDSSLTIWNSKHDYYSMMSQLSEVHEYTRLAMQYPLKGEKNLIEISGPNYLKFWLDEFPMPTDAFMQEKFPVTVEEYDQAMEQEQIEHAKSSLRIKKEVAKESEAEDNEVDLDQLVTVLEKEDPNDILKELDSYVGLQDFKDSMRSLVVRVQFDQARQAQALNTDSQNYHTALLGNPGTGKTTCARIKARLLHSLGLTGPRYVEIGREHIVGKYVGTTEDKFGEILNNADSLFIDEAYALADGGDDNKNDYGRVALNMIVKRLGNEKDDLTLMVAGYPEPMKEFIKTNEGLKSRIKCFDNMKNYTMDELGKILDINLDKRQYKIDEDARTALLNSLEDEKKDQENGKHFGNAREIVNLVQSLPNHVAARLHSESSGNLMKFNSAVLSRITLADVQKALKTRQLADVQAKKPTIGFHFPEPKPQSANCA